jgi:hypothetical protein
VTIFLRIIAVGNGQEIVVTKTQEPKNGETPTQLNTQKIDELQELIIYNLCIFLSDS